MTNSNFKPVAEQLAHLKKGIAEIVPEADLTAKLEKSKRPANPSASISAWIPPPRTFI